MSQNCLIYESRAFIKCAAAKGLALLLGLVDGVIQGAARTCRGFYPQSPCRESHAMNVVT